MHRRWRRGRPATAGASGRRPRALPAAVAAVFAVALFACSDDESADSDGARTTTDAEPVPATASAPATSPTVAATPPTSAAPASTAAPAPTSPATVPATQSPGCEAPGPPEGVEPGAPATFDFGTSDIDGTYIEQLPSGYDASAPAPLVLNLHGYSSPAQFQHDIAAFADAPGGDTVIVVTPAITRDIPRWEAQRGSDDVAFVTALLDHVTAERCVDEARVYATGFSNGGFMSSTLACELPDRIAAVAPVAGIVDPPDCDTGRHVPILTFHGTEDEFVTFEGGIGPAAESLPRPDDTDVDAGTETTADDTEETAGPERIAIPDIVAAWADRYGCAGPEREPVADDVGRTTYDCDGRPTVIFYRIDGGGHTWPGSEQSAAIESVVGPTTFSIDASEIILGFFADNPLGN